MTAGSTAVDAAVTAAVAEAGLPGVVAMSTDRHGLRHAASAGVRRLGDGPAMSTDTVFWLASMTKAVTATAALRLVEQGLVTLDAPVADIAPELGSPMVLTGFDESGVARLRPARRSLTLRHLLTHTSGYGHDVWNRDVLRFVTERGLPSISDSRMITLSQPLVADPGDRWEYGIGLEWVGRLIEMITGQRLDRQLRESVLDPLGMRDTGFVLRPDQRARLAAVHQRAADGAVSPTDFLMPQDPEYFIGGGGLYGTVPDYLAFIRMILADGRTPDGSHLLKPTTVEQLAHNQIGRLRAGVMTSVRPASSCDVDAVPGQACGWSLGFLINPAPMSTGRSAGSMSWAGLANTHFWIDRRRGIGGVFATQLLPFADPAVLHAYRRFETAVYADLDPLG